ncbi:hypothetical protein PDE_00662 [Penicillium oxalicum 114-2]|uniref:Uncharacterized protein n=1 Tax=Penicillium oxalicum (strain 114-2 / CGMCC 5302) TaxID=933388 RepID=S7ZAL3_PENO1|nr:hypothetical protein PDE_00662 [Penicillium oxalicum 114-2]
MSTIIPLFNFQMIEMGVMSWSNSYYTPALLFSKVAARKKKGLASFRSSYYIQSAHKSEITVIRSSSPLVD